MGILFYHIFRIIKFILNLNRPKGPAKHHSSSLSARLVTLHIFHIFIDLPVETVFIFAVKRGFFARFTE
jgi:hypothetical protein